MFLIVFCFFLACSSAKKDPQTITIGVEADIQSLDPRYAPDALSSKINRLIYAGLFKLNDQLEIEPSLVDQIVKLDANELVVTLKENVVFHNGKKLSAKDVIATLESILNPENSFPLKADLSHISKMEALDEKTIRFIFKDSFAPLLTALTVGILPEEIAKKPRTEFIPIGCGPYVLDQRREGEKIVLKKFENFFGEAPKNNRLIFKVIGDDTVRAYELIQGSVDLVQNAIPPLLVPAFEKQKNLSIETDEGINFVYLGFNLNNPILKNKKVREAFFHALDRKTLIKNKLYNLGTLAHSLLSPKHWAFYDALDDALDDAQNDATLDIKKSKVLLDEAGFSDPDGDGPKMRFYLSYKTSNKKDRVEMALLIAEQLKKIGVGLNVEPAEWGTFFRDIRNGNSEVYSLTWVGVTEPDIFYYAFHSSQFPPNGANRSFYSNPEMDKLTQAGRMIFDLTERKKIYQKIQEIFATDLPYIPLWYEKNYVIINKRIKNFRLRPDAGFDNLVYAHE